MSNQTIQTILTRRSIRQYKPEQISDEELEEILCAAMYAPSARNQQAWHFTVVQNKAALAMMKTALKEGMLTSGVEFLMNRASDPDFVAFHNAPTLIVISADAQVGGAIDCGAAAENIALAAESLGIGSCLMASSEMAFKSPLGEDLRTELGIPQGYEHVCTVALGYKDCEQPPAKPRRDNLVNYVR